MFRMYTLKETVSSKS